MFARGIHRASWGIRPVSDSLTSPTARRKITGVGIRVLGPVEVDGGESLRPRDRLVLAALAVRPGRALAADEIAEAVWSTEPPASWPKQVQICVARLRKVLGFSAIATRPEAGYSLVTEQVELDSIEFVELLDRGRHLAAAGEPDRAATALTRALALVRGTPFSMLEHWPPAGIEAARVGELVLGAEDDLVEARLAVGEHRELVSLAESLVAQQPLRERRWAALALAQYRCGRQADALRTLRRARALLREQLGVDPGPDLVSLEELVLRQDDSLRSAPTPRIVSAECPYKARCVGRGGPALRTRLRDRCLSSAIVRLTRARGDGSVRFGKVVSRAGWARARPGAAWDALPRRGPRAGRPGRDAK